MKKYLVGAALLTMALIAGCGGSSNSSTKAITGKVADGYLVNATVFLDKNGNYMLDDGEPFTTTDATGAYTLTVDPADVGKYPIVAMATQGVTIDLDHPGQTVASSYILSIPKDAISGTVSTNFISPMSSQLREMMETGSYGTIQEAMVALGSKLGMPGTNMMQDYMATGHGGMHTAAQNMAAVMGAQMAQVMSNHSSATRINVDRYRGMMGGIFSNMSTVRGDKPHAEVDQLAGMMATILRDIPPMNPGRPYRNMSSAFHGRMGMMMGR